MIYQNHFKEAETHSLATFTSSEEARTAYALWKVTDAAQKWHGCMAEFARPVAMPHTQRSPKTYQAAGRFVQAATTRMVAAIGERLAFTLCIPPAQGELETQGLIHRGRLEVVNSLLGEKIAFDRETPAEERYALSFGRTSMLRILWSLNQYSDQVESSKEVPRLYGAAETLLSEYRLDEKQLQETLQGY